MNRNKTVDTDIKILVVANVIFGVSIIAFSVFKYFPSKPKSEVAQLSPEAVEALIDAYRTLAFQFFPIYGIIFFFMAFVLWNYLRKKRKHTA